VYSNELYTVYLLFAHTVYIYNTSGWKTSKIKEKENNDVTPSRLDTTGHYHDYPLKGDQGRLSFINPSGVLE